MILLIFLIAGFLFGMYLIIKSWDYDILGVLMAIVFGVALFIHSLAFGLKTYSYEIFVEKRNSFEKTLDNARENGNEYETAAIVKEVSDWNMKLASAKYDNKTFLLDQYIDDRIEDLEPIQ